MLCGRKFEFPLERAVYLATLSRLFFPGSDRRTIRRARDYRISGEGSLPLHHLYGAMSFLGGERERIEDELFQLGISPVMHHPVYRDIYPERARVLQ